MKKKILFIGLLCAAVTIAAVAKVFFFHPVKDAYFAMDARSLRKVPAGLVVVRPTHFAFVRGKGILRAQAPPSDRNDPLWVMGRNVPLRDVMAQAYDWDPARIVLPSDAPTGHFDFLMTCSTNQQARFQSVVRRKLGYSGQKESRDMDVLALKIVNPSLPALTISPPDAARRIMFQNEKLHFQALSLGVLVNVFGRFLDTPLVDKTGTTNVYDFTIEWNSKTDQFFEEGTMTREKIDQILATLGLKLEPDTAPLEMLVVKKED